jgi:hypothetical protein
MDALATTPVEAFVMQDGVDRFGGRSQLASGCRPGIPKQLSSLASATKARPMSRRESDRLIEEE